MLVVLIATPVAVGLLLGALVAFVLQPFFDRLRLSRLSSAQAAAICAFASSGFIGASILGVGLLLVSRGLVLLKALPDALAPGGALHPLAERVAALLGTLHLAPDDPLARLREGVGSLAYHTSGLATGCAKAGAFALLTLLFLGLATYFSLLHWPAIVRRAERDLPFAPAHTRALFAEFRNVGRQILFGTVSAGLLQGLLAGLGCWLTGVPEATFIGALTAAVSQLPGVGATLIWLAVGAFQILTGHVTSGIVELVYGAVVVSATVDYVIRPRLVGQSHLPAVFTFVGLFGGVAVFGPIGLIVGPVVVSLCFAVLRIYDEEVLSELQVAAEQRSPTAPS